jgi:hypothetical protein
VISRSVAIGLSDLYRQHRQSGITAVDAWQWLRLYEPDANVFERRRIEARGEDSLEIYLDVTAASPPAVLYLRYPLPPSTEAEVPYLLETVWRVTLLTPGGAVNRMLIVTSPNGSLWASVLSDLTEGLVVMSIDYDAEDDPDVEFILVR